MRKVQPICAVDSAYGVPFRKLFISSRVVSSQIVLTGGRPICTNYTSLRRLFKRRISKVLAGTACDGGLPGAISKSY